MQPSFTTIVLPTRPQPDTLVAFFILKKYGKERFPGIEDASIQVWQSFPDGETENSLLSKGILLIDFGGGRFDHHNKEIKTTAANLVAEYLCVQDEASLAKLLEYARRDDFYGKGTMSPDPIDKALGLSGIISALNKFFPKNPEKVPDYIIPLLYVHHAEEIKRTQELPKEFENLIQSEKADVFYVKQRDKKLRVATIISDNASMAGYLRSQQGGRHDVILQKISSGHVNILTRPTKRVDLRSLAALIRLKEIRQSDISHVNMRDFAKTGQIKDVLEWYFDPATNSLLNGGLNPQEILPTKISYNEFRGILEDGLSEKIWRP